MRSYQMLRIFICHVCLLFAARQISVSVLLIYVYGIIPVFLFKNNTKSIGIGLILLTVLMFYAIANFHILKLEMAFFIAGAVAALSYKV